MDLHQGCTPWAEPMHERCAQAQALQQVRAFETIPSHWTAASLKVKFNRAYEINRLRRIQSLIS